MRASAFYGAALLLPLDKRIGGKQHIELSLKFINCVKCENFPRVFEIKKVSRTPPPHRSLYLFFRKLATENSWTISGRSDHGPVKHQCNVTPHKTMRNGHQRSGFPSTTRCNLPKTARRELTLRLDPRNRLLKISRDASFSCCCLPAKFLNTQEGRRVCSERAQVHDESLLFCYN